MSSLFSLNQYKATVHAETHNHVKLKIRFYKCSKDDASAGSFIMEIHRLSSSSVGFRGLTKIIFDFVKGETESLSFFEINERGWSIPSNEDLSVFEGMEEELNSITKPSFETLGQE